MKVTSLLTTGVTKLRLQRSYGDRSRPGTTRGGTTLVPLTAGPGGALIGRLLGPGLSPVASPSSAAVPSTSPQATSTPWAQEKDRGEMARPCKGTSISTPLVAT